MSPFGNASGTFYGMSPSVWQMPLNEFQFAVAAPQPAPAGVATSCVVAALALSLLVKVLRIRGQREELIDPALQLIEDLRVLTDADIAAVRGYIQTRNAQAMKDIPRQAEHAVAQGLILCAAAAESITGLIAADIAAATTLLDGAASAIAACVAANR